MAFILKTRKTAFLFIMVIVILGSSIAGANISLKNNQSISQGQSLSSQGHTRSLGEKALSLMRASSPTALSVLSSPLLSNVAIVSTASSVDPSTSTAGNLVVYVGYADSLRANGFFPDPWQSSTNVTFIGGGGTFDSGAIRIDNTGTSNITIDSVSVLLHGTPSPGCYVGNFCTSPQPFNLWGSSIVLRPGFHLILTQTGCCNFDSSDNPFEPCGVAAAVGQTPLPAVSITVSGATHQLNDTAHVLDTLGYDLACQGNESEQWRPIGSFRGNPELTLMPLSDTGTVGSTHTVTATLVNNATGTGTAISGGNVNVTVTGANTTVGSCLTDANGKCSFAYTGVNPGTDVIIASAIVGGVLVHSPPAQMVWTGSPDFSISSSPANITVLAGGLASYQVTVTKVASFTQNVTLKVSGLPVGAASTFLANPVIPSATTSLQISTSAGIGLGDYNLTITGTAGTVFRQASVKLHIYDFTVTSSLCQQTVLRGSVAPFNLTLALVTNSSTVNLPPITLQVTGLPSDATVFYQILPSSQKLPAPIVLTLSTIPVTIELLVQTGGGSTGSLGDFPFSITAVDGRPSVGGARRVSNCQGAGGQGFTAHVFQPIVTYSCQTNLVSGGSISCTFNISLVFGSSNFSLPKITPGFINLPTGTFVLCGPASAAPPFTSACVLTFPVGFTGGGALTIQGFGGISGIGGVTVQGTTPGGGTSLILHIYDFTVQVSPQETVLRGGKAVYTITVALVPGSTNVNLPTIGLSLSGLPSAVTAVRSPTSGNAAGFTSTLVLQTNSSTPLGDFSFNVTGTDARPLLGGFRIGTGLLHIYDFTITSAPSSTFSTPGGTASYNETLTLLTGSSTIGVPQITVILKGLPTGTTTAFNPTLIIPTFAGNTTQLTIFPGTPGTFSLTVLGNDTRAPEGGVRSSLPLSPQSLTVLVQGGLTDTSYCPFDVDSSLPGQQFRLIFTPNPTSPATYELTASNPGQFYYNAFFAGTPSSTVRLTVKVPYPFVTQGAVPIQVYSSVGFSGPCFVPMNNMTPGFAITAGRTLTPSGAAQIVLTDYSSQASGSFVTVTITGQVPASGLVYVTIHLNYGLKGSIGYGKDANDNAINATSSAVLIPNLQTYSFAQTASGTNGIHLSTTVTVENENVFKKDPGIAGLVRDQNGTPVPGVVVQIYDSTGHLLATVFTDKDGWYMWSYKYTGKPTTFTVSLPSFGQSQSLALKSNGFAIANFTLDKTS